MFYAPTTTDKWDPLKSKNMWGPCAVMAGEMRGIVCALYQHPFGNMELYWVSFAIENVKKRIRSPCIFSPDKVKILEQSCLNLMCSSCDSQLRKGWTRGALW
jgi:hypothetical protein